MRNRWPKTLLVALLVIVPAAGVLSPPLFAAPTTDRRAKIVETGLGRLLSQISNLWSLMSPSESLPGMDPAGLLATPARPGAQKPDRGQEDGARPGGRRASR